MSPITVTFDQQHPTSPAHVVRSLYELREGDPFYEASLDLLHKLEHARQIREGLKRYGSEHR